MIIPVFSKQKLVDKDGMMTSHTQQTFDIFFDQAQENISNDGFVIPSQPTDQINLIADPANPNAKPDGTMWYDTETQTLKVKINGTVRTITTT